MQKISELIAPEPSPTVRSGMDSEPDELPENIQLTQQEIDKVLADALSMKQAKARERLHWKKVNNPPDLPKFTPEEFLAKCIQKFEQEFNQHFIIDDHNRTLLELLSWYFTRDDRFENAGYSLNKGLFLYGNVGCGKTTIMKMFRRNPVMSFHVTSCRKIATAFAQYGAEAIDPYYNNMQATGDNPFRQEFFGMCFDDLGTEDTKKHFGNEANVMQEILLSRYELNHNNRFHTHITTNLTADMIEEFYGKRIRSRMREMFNSIPFAPESPDRRA